MKKLLMGAFALSMLVACNAGDENLLNQEGNDLTANSSGASAQRMCPSEEIREEALAKNPELMAKFTENENLTKQFANDLALGKVLADGSVDIPVVVNVLYRTTAENVSATRIAEQIAVLNADFAGTNTDASKIPTEFSSLKAGDTKVRFHLIKTVRKATTETSWSTNDAMKKSSTGGIDATSPASYFNIWIVGDMGGVLGYATFPESAGQWNDGVVLASKYTGVTGATAPYNLGRTATHEVGHYLNLRHIWGDATCGNDFVADTPTQTGSNGGSPTYPLYNTCGGVKRSVMFMNYMDYVDDAAMYMFSSGQKARMMAVTSTSGPRAGLRVY